MQIKFEGTIRKVGTSCVVTIPSDYINGGLLKEGEKYNFFIKEKEANNDEGIISGRDF